MNPFKLLICYNTIIIKLFLLLVLHNCSFSSFSQGWTQKTDFPSQRYRATAFAIGDTGYVGLGLTPDKLERAFWKYIPDKDKWEQIDSFPGPARFATFSFVINGKGYVGGGGVVDNYPRNDLYEYDPEIGKWSRKADFPIFVGNEGTMAGFSIKNKGYVVAQFNDNNFLEYSPETNSWKVLKNFPGESKLDFIGFSYENKGYIGCGFGSGSGNTNELWEFDPISNEWNQKSDFPGIPRSKEVIFKIGRYAYVGMGLAQSIYRNDFWRYDMKNDTWTQVDSCGYGAYGAFAMSVSGKGYVGTGISLEKPEFWEYTPLTISIEEIADNKISLYPNPFSDIMYIKNPDQKTYTVNFYNLQGKRIKAICDSPESIQTSDLSKGIYLLEIIMDNTRISKTFIKN